MTDSSSMSVLILKKPEEPEESLCFGSKMRELGTSSELNRVDVLARPDRQQKNSKVLLLGSFSNMG